MRRKALFSVNLAVLLFGLAGLFAKGIRMPAIGITFGRVFFSALSLLVFLAGRRQSIRLRGKRDLFLLLCAGGVLALHWWTFLASIQLSSVAIGTITFSSFPLFVAFLEPLVFHQKLRAVNVGVAMVILLGVIITIPELSFQNRQFLGVLVGMLSSLSYALLTLLNKTFAAPYPGPLISFYEQASATILLLPFVLRAGIHPTGADVALLALLGVVMTALAHTLFISSLRELPAWLAGACSSMETVYGILFAFLVFQEVPSLRECAGAAVIIAAVLYAQIAGREAHPLEQ